MPNSSTIVTDSGGATWTVAPDNCSAVVTGRTPKPWYLKLFVPWWFYNSDEPTPPVDYVPSLPAVLRYLMWYLRNPLRNFGSYVIGVCDRNFTVSGTPPILNTTLTDADPTKFGAKWSVIRLGILWLPFWSYQSPRWILYAGWQPGSGFFGFKVNLANSPLQAV